MEAGNSTKSMQTVRIPLTGKELSQLKRIEKIMLGSIANVKRKPDCLHVFEAEKIRALLRFFR